ncbi:MAG TPA: transglutaminase-like domain-containing protein [Gemmataceae bacterium]|nr:transglutaminase-like domain-containing protein [Gemmataceae bacterium]
MILPTLLRRFPVTLALLALSALPTDAAGADPKMREFFFTYQTTATGLSPGQTARIWLPVPPSNADQDVTIVKQDLPAKGTIRTEPKYGNQVLYLEAKADPQGKIAVGVVYRVKRREVKADLDGKADSDQNLERFLKPDSRVPVGGKPLTLIAGLDLPADQLRAGRVLYDVVNNHMRYSKEGTGWGQGDAVWACDSGYGNCSDFHSLFISLARSLQIPARFEIGFPLPEKRGQGEIAGYHCWAKFKPKGRGWVPVDISEANKNPAKKEYFFGNLSEDRVAFSEGRDLTLVPKQDGPPLNFFVYPYVEVGGKPYPPEKLQNRFAYQDVEPGK